MPLPSPARPRLSRPLRVTGWTALAFAGLTLCAGIGHADEGVSPDGLAVAGVERHEPVVGGGGARVETHGDHEAGRLDAEEGGRPATDESASVDEAGSPAAPGIQSSDGAAEEADASDEDTDDVAGSPERAEEGEPDVVAEPEPEADPVPAEDGDAPAVVEDVPLEDGLIDAAPLDAAPLEDGLIDAAPLETAPLEDAVAEDPVAEPADPQPAVVDPAAVPAQLLVERPLPRAAASVAPASAPVGFTDVPAGMMYAEEIQWLQREGIATGWPDGTYRPLESVNRDAFVAMLFRLHAPQSYVASAQSPFRDVSTSDLFYREISWAAEERVTTGWADGTFRPLAPIDRDAAMAMLQRSFGGGVPAPSRSPFIDVAPHVEHYDAMAWGFANGITTGWSDGSFRPQEDINRDAVAAMLHRLAELGPDPQRGLLAGPTGSFWSASGGQSLLGAPTGYQYSYGSGLRQDFAGGSVLYSPSTWSTVALSGQELRIYDSRGALGTFGLPISPLQHRDGDSGLQFAEGGIYAVDGYTFAVTGQMYDRYLSLGGIRGYLGAPIGDQRTGSSGITYQSFKGGQLTTPHHLDVPPPTTPSGGTRITYRTLSTGSRGDDVHAVQVKVGAAADGVFGSQTRAAVMRFQREQGIPETGVVDSRTWARIMSTPDQRFDGSNGRLAAHQLTVIAPNWTLPNHAAAPYLAMQRAFTADTGRTFTLNDAYRPIDRQIMLLVALGRPTAAYPGTSNHGDARTGAVDIQVTRGDVTHRWLVANAARFGFGQTAWQAANEPWHWQRMS